MSLGDLIFLGIVIAFCIAIYQGFTRGSSALSESIQHQKDALKKSGIDITDGGLSIKTDRRAPTREDQIDATQRAFAAAGETMNRHREALSWGGGGGTRQTAEDVFGKAGKAQ